MTDLPSDNIQKWFAEKEFTADWTSGHIRKWYQILDRFRDQTVEILEIGSLEGRSAIFFLEFMPKAQITCIDIFPGDYGDRFDRNLEPYSARLTKIKGRSVSALDTLLVAKKKFDFIYVDGSHRREDVLTDSVLAWRLLKIGGILIWDDYKWRRDQPSEVRPEHAIDLFCSMFAGCYEELHRDYQVIIKKTAEWPPR